MASLSENQGHEQPIAMQKDRQAASVRFGRRLPVVRWITDQQKNGVTKKPAGGRAEINNMR